MLDQETRIVFDRAFLYLEERSRENLIERYDEFALHEDADLILPLVKLLPLSVIDDYLYIVNTLDAYLSRFEENESSPFYLYGVCSLLRAYVLGREYDKVFVLADRARKLPFGLSKAEEIGILWRVGNALFTNRKYHESIHQLSIAAELAMSLKDDVTKARIMADIASATINTADFAKAILLMEDSLLVLSAKGQYKESCYMIRLNLASVYQRIGRNEDALNEYAYLLAAESNVKDRKTLCALLLNSAIAYKSVGKMSESLSNYTRLLNLAQELSLQEFEIRAQMGLAHLYELQKEYHRAKTAALESIRLAEFHKIDSLIASTKGAIASIYWSDGDVERAIDLLYEAFQKTIDDGDTSQSLEFGGDLVKWLKADERFAEALKVQTTCVELQKSVYANELGRTLELSEVRSRFDVERESIRHREEERNKILNAVVPQHIAERLMAGETRIAESIPDVTILFADIVGFTRLSVEMEPEKLLRMLEELFTAFDVIAANHGCERIKTIGDSYMAMSGATGLVADHTERMCRVAIDFLNNDQMLPIEAKRLRIGIHTGPVIAGVMAGAKLSYDVWGDTVNVAARMESHSQPGRVLCSPNVADKLVHNLEFKLEKREPLDVRGKGLMTTFWLGTS